MTRSYLGYVSSQTTDTIVVGAEFFEVEYLVVAGGGSGAAGTGNGGVGGGGAGGYRSSVVGESSGGGASAESVLAFFVGNSLTVTVGAGAANASGSNGVKGSNSVFGVITCEGGGGGHECERGHNDLVAGAYATEDRRHLEGVGAGGREEAPAKAIPFPEELVAPLCEDAVAGYLPRSNRLGDVTS